MASELSFKPIGTIVKTKNGLERIADVDPRLTRSYYFDSRLLTAEDLNRDQIYLDGRLREVGQALGYGVVNGLEASLSDLDGIITVKPGSGVTRAGRVLELTQTLTLDLGDKATISELNNGSFRRLDRALYVVVVKYSEVGTDVAEAFPTDLGSNRTFKYDVMTEGVQLTLVRLPQALGQQSSISIRANLLREWLGDNTAGGAVPEDGIALGVVAISNDKPIWLDSQLLRQPLRSVVRAGDLQADLGRRYENVLRDLLAERSRSSLNNDFAASDYFRLLPPVGSLPKDAINPVTGRQGYFPEHFNVWITPVRTSDLELVRTESLGLPPIDTHTTEPIDVIVLVPLANALYGKYAQQLEQPLNQQTRLLPSQDLMRLRLYPRQLDTDSSVWNEILSKTTVQQFIYIRRPLRAAETRLSAISLAQGVPLSIDEVELDPIPSPADHDLLETEDGAFLNLLNIKKLTQLRPPLAVPGDLTDINAKIESSSALLNDAVVIQKLASALIHIDHQYDSVVWQTLIFFVEKKVLDAFVAALLLPSNKHTPVVDIVTSIGTPAGLDVGILKMWKTLSTPSIPLPELPPGEFPISGNFVELPHLIKWRDQPNDESKKAAENLTTNFGASLPVVQGITTALMRIERAYDSVVWPTLLTLVEKGSLDKFVNFLLDPSAANLTTGQLVEKVGNELGLDDSQIKAWILIG